MRVVHNGVADERRGDETRKRQQVGNRIDVLVLRQRGYYFGNDLPESSRFLNGWF